MVLSFQWQRFIKMNKILEIFHIFLKGEGEHKNIYKLYGYWFYACIILETESYLRGGVKVYLSYKHKPRNI